MFTQRYSRTLVVGFILHTTILGATLIGCSRVTPAKEPQAASAPRTLLRLPGWLESFTRRSAHRPPAARQKQAPATAPVAPQAPAAFQVDPTASPVESDDEKRLAELSIPSTPADSAEGKPGRALVRSRDTSAVDAHALLAAGWTDLVPGESAGPTPDEATPRPELGPEASVLNPSAARQDTAIASSSEELPASDPVTAQDEEPASSDTAVEAEPVADVAPPIDQPLAVPMSDAPDDTPTLAIDPASFRGVFPGKTTLEEVEQSWGKGEAFTREDGSTGRFWQVEPFERVEVIADGQTVGSILIKLAEPTAISELAKQLEIDDIRTVSVLDDQGVSIGDVYPERGVIFSLMPGTRAVQALILEPLDPESFVLRAEGELDSNTAFATADLQYAIEIDPRHLRALRLLLALRCDQGKWADALVLARQAEKTDPKDIWTRLKHAGVLVALEQTDAARQKVAAVRTEPNVSPLVVAQAERMLGRIELASANADYQKAVEHFGEAIRTATPLLGAASAAAQKAARDVVLDAHLGTALAIAKGTWQQKSRVIPKWITRSETIAAEVDAKTDTKAGEKHAIELQLCRGALAVAAGSTESFDPLPWVKRLLQVRAKLDETTTDPWRRRQIDWEVGQALSDAIVAAQKRGDAEDMLDNSTLTAAYLERGAEFRQLTATERKNLGDLMFRIGILHSLQQGNHATAVTWFDKALPLWEGNPSLARVDVAGQLGESFVSMAISYWQIDRRDEAVTICRKGVDLMVDAVARKQLDEQSLAVAYGNLSTMYAERGDAEASRDYAELASRAEASGTVRK